jgi:hypothetical protein
MSTESSDLGCDQQDLPMFMKLPTEIRLHIYEIAREDILT